MIFLCYKLVDALQVGEPDLVEFVLLDNSVLGFDLEFIIKYLFKSFIYLFTNFGLEIYLFCFWIFLLICAKF